MLKKIKERVYKANLELVNRNLVIYTWGNVSEIDRKTNLVVIKPSGIEYNNMKVEDMVVVDLKTGEVVEGNLKPSSDVLTHLEIYKNFPEIGGITHTHSINAVAFAQAGLDIQALGTTHADYFYGDIPCTRELTECEVEKEYEKNTGKVIVEEIKKRRLDIMTIPSILVRNHGPFCWGKNASESVYNAVILEKIAEMAMKTIFLNRKANIKQYMLDKHYKRKHGRSAYYGQRKSRKLL